MPLLSASAASVSVTDSVEEAMEIAVETRQKRGKDRIVRPNASHDSRYRKGELVAVQGAKPA